MEDDLVAHRTREASSGAQCTNHSANSMYTLYQPSFGIFGVVSGRRLVEILLDLVEFT